ncbi:MAG: histidine--tRNA ligase [Oscillospiraceae bacterium]|nr:histidine--tRNA ligase [Oscillospiraceae bacterium]
MATNAAPVKGTKDYLPKEAAARYYIENIILSTYRQNGFQRIETPMIESIERLDKSNGGENLSLIFKILKRGEKLNLNSTDLKENDLVDSGLRYDLTLPLARYFANNSNWLRKPFKVVQCGKVFRAERPQKGRLREFCQCDIDIIGDESIDAEIELISVTSKALMNLGFFDFVVRINDRRILKDIVCNAGFNEEDIHSVYVTVDKLEKIGIHGVQDELIAKGFAAAPIEQLLSAISDHTAQFGSGLSSNQKASEDLLQVIESTNRIAASRYKVVFDKTLVRGMGYYTGMVFEIITPLFGAAIAGGGRYDNMIGSFTNEQIPAVGLSIGFERIMNIILESGNLKPEQVKSVLLIYGETSDIVTAIEKANELKQQGYNVTIIKKAKNVGKQLSRLKKDEFDCLCDTDKTGELVAWR